MTNSRRWLKRSLPGERPEGPANDEGQANHLVEGERAKTKDLAGTVVGTTKNCVSIQWDGRSAPEIFTTDEMRHISEEGPLENDRK
jgi:hypothetical protein